jgi:glutaredoxin 3
MVILYTARYCPFCEKAINLIFKKGVNFAVRDVTGNKELRESLEKETGCPTVPLVFIKNKFVGGCSDLFELDNKGELDVLLAISDRHGAQLGAGQVPQNEAQNDEG